MAKNGRFYSFIFFIIIGLTCCTSFSFSQNVIAESDPSITTDTLRSGDLVIGINSNGGGVINYMEIPGVGNIFGPQSVKYGRSGQSAMRDALHGGRYNPTQAGFNETLGTPCVLVKENGGVTVPARPLALWYGDCQWDFTEWENIGPDPTCYPDGGNSDVDELDESNLAGKQNTEVKSEFDYFGFYHDYKNKGNIDISCVRHYFEYRYVREPGHCINQFRPGLDIYKPEQIHPDISSAFPEGLHTAEPFDMSNFILSWHLRNDVVNWDPKYQFIAKNGNTWTIQNREVYVKETLDKNGEVIMPRLLIISDSNNPDADNALGFYMPESEFNNHETIGVDETTGLINYKDRRYQSIRIWDQPRRISTMAVYGFKTETKGILNRTRLPKNIYEAYRFDMFILKGSPNEIWETVNRIENASTVWNFNAGLDNWTISGGDVSVSDSSLFLANTGEESVFISPDSLLIDAALHKFVTIRIKNNSPDSTASLSFKSYDGNISAPYTFRVEPNNINWQILSVNVSSLQDWTGIIRRIELAFPGTSGDIEVDFIGVSADGISDCNGDFNGMAYFDACGTCVGGNTGIEPCEDCMGVINGEAFINACGDCVGGTSPLQPVNEWHFDSLSNWELNARLSGMSNDGIAKLGITGNDPFMNYLGNVCINTKEFNTIKLRLKNNTNGTGATVYYQNDVSNSWKFKTIPVSTNDAQLKNYTVDMSADENWVGNILKIRFDPPGTSGTLELDYLGILKDGIATGLNDFSVNDSENRISLFPNPANERFFIKTQKESEIIVFNSRGMEVYRNTNSQNVHIVETNNWNPGLYLVKVIDADGIGFAKSLIYRR